MGTTCSKPPDPTSTPIKPVKWVEIDPEERKGSLVVKLITGKKERDLELQRAIAELDRAVNSGTGIHNDDKETEELSAPAPSSTLPSNWQILETASWQKAIPGREPSHFEAFTLWAVGTIVSFMSVNLVYKWISKKLDSRLLEALKTHTSGYEFQTTKSIKLCKRDRDGRVSVDYPLIRLTRYNDRGMVAFDLLLQAIIMNGDEVLKIRPLRLFLKEPAAKQQGGKITIAASLHADAIWQNDERLKDALKVQDLLLATVDVKNGQPFYDCKSYWNIDQDEDDAIVKRTMWQPLLPFAVLNPLSVTVVEVGDVAWLKANVAQLVDKGDRVADLLGKIAQPS